ncbi:MAG: Hpt domain-containing protein [Caldilineaceae bacterium]
MDGYVAKPARVSELRAELMRNWTQLNAPGDGAPDAPELPPPAVTPADTPFDPPAAPSAASSPVLEPAALARLTNLVGGDPTILGELIDSFLTDAPALLTEMQQAVDAQDAATLHRAAHTLKSNAADFGAQTLSELCRELEALGKTAALTDAAALVNAATAAYAPVADALTTLQSENPS